jgi:transposase
MRRPPRIVLTAGERNRLGAIVRSGEPRSRRVVRARIVLLAAEGRENRAIADRLGAAPATVGRWRRRFAVHRVPGIERDAPRPGRPPSIPTATLGRIVILHQGDAPGQRAPLSFRAIARQVGVSRATVERVCRAHRAAEAQHSLAGRRGGGAAIPGHITDFVGLFLNPPHRAVAFSIDPKQAASTLGGRGEGAAPGQVGRSAGEEFRAFLQAVDRETPGELSVYLLATASEGPTSPEVRRWLVQHPRFRLRLVPNAAPHPNVLDRLLDGLSRPRRRRTSPPGPARLHRAIREHFATLRVAAGPFVWTATGEEIRRRPSYRPDKVSY